MGRRKVIGTASRSGEDHDVIAGVVGIEVRLLPWLRNLLRSPVRPGCMRNEATRPWGTRSRSADSRLRLSAGGMSMVGMTTTTVRTPTADDAAQVGEAHAAAWETGYAEIFAPDVLSVLADARRQMWTSIFADPTFDFGNIFVAECEAEVVGYSHFGCHGEDASKGEVFGFYAHPRVWGTGVSAAMMRASLTQLRARSLSPVVVWTLERAGRARAFYAKSGFTGTGRRRRVKLFPIGLEVVEVEYELAV
jgi:GNAT superfamily N-acetyltransferase